MIPQFLRRLFSKRVRIETVNEGTDKTPRKDQPQSKNQSTQKTSSSSPDNEKTQHATYGAQVHAYPISDDVKEISEADVLSEKREENAPISIANYQDLLLATKHKLNLGRISEYPPQPRVIDGVSVDVIMAFFADAIRQSADDLPMERNEIDELFLPVVRRGLMYMHLLPASQFHHHNGIGGLFAHSLQVANLAVRLGKQKVFNQKDTPRELYQNGKRWLFGCWLAGFLHDIGKTVTDVTVTSEGETWYPYSSSLVAWLQDNNIKNYHFIWRSAGHNKHVQSTLMFVREIVPAKTFDWLADYGAREIWEACESALVNTSAKDNLISEVVQQADEFTTGQDIEERNQGKIDTRRMGGSLPAAEYIVDALQLLISEGTIKVNGKGSILRVTTAGTFIIWTTKASELIYAKVLEEKHSSVPRKIDRMLDCLITGGLVEPTPESFNGPKGYIWPVIYDMFPSQALKSIKLRTTYALFNGLVPPDPELAIINGWEGQDPQNIAAWEKKYGKLIDDSVATNVPLPDPDEYVPDVVDGQDPDLLIDNTLLNELDEAHSINAPSRPLVTTAKKIETQEERAQFAAQIKAVLGGQFVVEAPKPAPETTGGIPSNIQPDVKPSPQSMKDVQDRFESGDLSFLAPSLTTRDKSGANHAQKQHQCATQPKVSMTTAQQTAAEAIAQDDAHPLKSQATLSTTDILMGRSSKGQTGKPKKNNLNMNPVVVSDGRPKERVTYRPAQETKKVDMSRPRINGKPISKRPPQETPKLSSELMAVFTGQASPEANVAPLANVVEKTSNQTQSTKDIRPVVAKPYPKKPKSVASLPQSQPVLGNTPTHSPSLDFSCGEEKNPSSVAPISAITADLAEAVLGESPFLKRPVEKEQTFATKTEALKYEKRMKTIENQREQSLVTVRMGDKETLVDTNKSMKTLESIEKNHECKTSEVSPSSAEVKSEKKILSVQEKLMLLRQEIIDQLLAGVGPLFPSGLMSVTDTERSADAEGVFERGKALGLDSTKVVALASGFQPGRWKLSIEALNKRAIITLREKAK